MITIFKHLRFILVLKPQIPIAMIYMTNYLPYKMMPLRGLNNLSVMERKPNTEQIKSNGFEKDLLFK